MVYIIQIHIIFTRSVAVENFNLINIPMCLNTNYVKYLQAECGLTPLWHD